MKNDRRLSPAVRKCERRRFYAATNAVPVGKKNKIFQKLKKKGRPPPVPGDNIPHGRRVTGCRWHTRVSLAGIFFFSSFFFLSILEPCLKRKPHFFFFRFLPHRRYLVSRSCGIFVSIENMISHLFL